MNGSVNLFTSRRGCWDECTYWKRSDIGDTVSLDRICYDFKPSGTFYAKENSGYSEQMERLDSAFSVHGTTTALQTNDDVSDVNVNDVIQFNSKMWRVTYIQKQRIRRKSAFNVDGTYSYVLFVKGS